LDEERILIVEVRMFETFETFKKDCIPRRQSKAESDNKGNNYYETGID